MVIKWAGGKFILSKKENIKRSQNNQNYAQIKYVNKNILNVLLLCRFLGN